MGSGVSGNLQSGDTLLGASEPLVGEVFSVAAVFGGCHPNLHPFLDFCRRGNLVPIHICLFFGLVIDCSSILGSSFMEGFGLVTPVVSLLLLFG